MSIVDRICAAIEAAATAPGDVDAQCAQDAVRALVEREGGVASADDVIGLLNEALALDDVAVSALVAYRFPCAARLRDHPTIQTGPHVLPEFGIVGMLGILNGLFQRKTDGFGEIAATVEPSSHIQDFRRTPVRAST